MTSRSADPGLAAAILEALPVATLVVDARLRVVHANAAARAALLGADAGAPLGEALACSEGAPGACARCAGCSIRDAVGRALAGERARARGFLVRSGPAGEPADLHVLVSAAPLLRGGVRRAVLVLEDADRILLDPGVVRICCGCGRVEEDGGAWLPLHRWLEDALGLETDALCDACAASARPDAPPA